MAINPIYRESWQKSNGWNVRVDFIAGGGEASKYDDRSVTNINSVFRDVSSHKASFGDSIPYGLADAESCKFVIDYERCPAGMKSAVIAQAATVSTSYFATSTVGKYRTPKYMPQSITGTYPRQPNLFAVWSDRGSSNGVVTGLSIAYGGYGWEFDETGVATTPYFPGAMDTVIGSGLTIDFTVVDSVINSVTVHNGGTGYKVGQQVKYVDPLVPERYAYFTITSVAAPTWYLEFAGCQRLSPSTKYNAEPTGLIIEIEAIGIHKIAMEGITDLTTFTRQFMPTQTDSGGAYNAARYVSGEISFPQSAYGSSAVYDWSYNYNSIGTRMVLSDKNRLRHWHAPLGAIFKYLHAAFDEAFEFFMMEGYQGASDNATNLSDLYPTTTSRVKFMKPRAWDGDYNTNVEFGETDGTLHDSAAELTTIRFIFAVSKEGTGYTNASDWAGGLFTDFDDSLRKDCDSAWDLLKKMAEQFFMKLTPYYEFTSGLLKAKWNASDPYAATLTASTITYADTASDASFETNAETRESVKLHYYVTGDQNESVEVTSYTKSGKKIEINNIFDIRYRTEGDEVQFDTNATIFARFLNLRGLFVLTYDYGTGGPAQLVAVSPRITISILTSGSTYVDYVTYNPYAYTSSPSNPNYALYYTPSKSTTAFMQRVRDIQSDSLSGFGLIAHILAGYFGVPTDLVNIGLIDYSSNNQTMYEMTRPLTTDTIPQMLGQRIDITPHAALSAQICEKAYAVDMELDWTAKEAQSDYVKVKYLTRSIRYD